MVSKVKKVSLTAVALVTGVVLSLSGLGGGFGARGE